MSARLDSHARVAVLSVALCSFGLSASAEPPSLEAIVAGNLEARGGGERWRAVGSLHLAGTYAAFSDYEPFELVRARGDLYRLEFSILGGPAIRAHDSVGPWWRHPLLQPESGRLEEGPYKAMLEREALFGPILLDYSDRGIEIEVVGPSEIEGIEALELVLTFPGGSQERWFLDPVSFREVAAEAQVHDFTQSPEPLRQRTFFDDFREVTGLVLPHRVEIEFGHRLETMSVEKAAVDLELEPTTFSPPPAAPSGE